VPLLQCRAIPRDEAIGDSVPRFITFFSYTGDAAKAMIDRPSDRSAAAQALVASVGGTLDGFFWMQGDHDGFLLTTLPDAIAAAALAAAAGSTGAITNFETHQIFDHDEQARIVTQAKQATAAYRPPTA
jgi:uncharacterized protein with GYD domain